MRRPLIFLTLIGIVASSGAAFAQGGNLAVPAGDTYKPPKKQTGTVLPRQSPVDQTVPGRRRLRVPPPEVAR